MTSWCLKSIEEILMSSTEQNTAATTPLESTATKAVAKKVARPAAKRVTRPATQQAVQARRPALATAGAAVQAVPVATVAAPVEAKSDKLLKPKKSKMVRENFTLPMLEYLMLETLKLRSGKLGSPVKKNVLIRAGIKALAALSDARFLAALKTVPSIKGTRATKD
jgi:hypothetical protein